MTLKKIKQNSKPTDTAKDNRQFINNEGKNWVRVLYFNPLNTQLNPICPLLALFGAHRILHISR
jgi:hypothetical protein